MKKRYYDFNTYFRSMFGGRVHKITVDAGFSCPNRDGKISYGGCIYCNPQGSGTGLFSKGFSVTDQLKSGSIRVIKRYKTKKFLAYFQSFTNTYAPIEKLKQVYEEALDFEGVIGLAVGTRPDCISDEVLELLEGYAKDYLVWIEYGLQSSHDKTLDYINRGHDFACFKEAVEKTRGRGINICAHVILGLPNENRKMMLETAKVLGDLGIDGVKLHLLYVVKGTPLEKLYKEGTFKCLGQREYAELVCDFIERLPENVVIQRITGDPHKRELVAPEWPLRKKETVEMIHDIFNERDSFQGKLVI